MWSRGALRLLSRPHTQNCRAARSRVARQGAPAAASRGSARRAAEPIPRLTPRSSEFGRVPMAASGGSAAAAGRELEAVTASEAARRAGGPGRRAAGPLGEGRAGGGPGVPALGASDLSGERGAAQVTFLGPSTFSPACPRGAGDPQQTGCSAEAGLEPSWGARAAGRVERGSD